jgi:hypothetical protein
MAGALATTRRVLALDPSTGGLGFVVLEGSQLLIDWGVQEVKDNRRNEYLRRIDVLILRYAPDVLVVEDCSARGARRCERVRRLLATIRELGSRRRLATRSISRVKIRRAFSDAGKGTKHDIALAIADRLPPLKSRLPPPRQPWMSEDYRMSIFDAAALGLAFFHSSRRSRKGDGRVLADADQS